MGKRAKKQEILIAGPAGALESIVEVPADAVPSGVAVVCHPHPLHGGTMQNKVAHTLARSFLASGFAALRFNFRGVGQSEGEFADGHGELQDVLAALDWAQREFPDVPVWLAGFSFGAAMAVRAAVEANPNGLISIAPAVSRFVDSLPVQPACPWLIVQGDQDELVDIEETVAWVNELDPGPELEVFADTKHFFHGKLVRLRETVEDFVRRNQ